MDKYEYDGAILSDPEEADDVDQEQEEEAVNGCLEDAPSKGTPVLKRVKRKAKRPSKFVTKEVLNRSISENGTITCIPAKCASKNSRKSRSFYGRGLPKKGGGGGKGTWGKLGSEFFDEDACAVLDHDDPNYDALDDKDVKLKVIDCEKTAEDFSKKITMIILEYFEHGETEEASLSLEELKLGPNKYLVVVNTIEVAMDHKPSHRELASVLLSDLYNEMLSSKNYAKGYDCLLRNLDDLVLDVPDASTILGNFTARSIADECIPPKFLQEHKGDASCSDLAVSSLTRAESLLSLKHGLVRLDNVWGVGGGTRPVRHLVKKIILLLEEYLSSSDIAEATHCLTDLEVPHFHHELVYEAIYIVLEKMNERVTLLVCKLLRSLCDAVILTPKQVKDGFLRIYVDMPQISLDVPLAYSILEDFVTRCYHEKICDVEIFKKVPLRGRKRFVSEGDGGRVKDHAYY